VGVAAPAAAMTKHMLMSLLSQESLIESCDTAIANGLASALRDGKKKASLISSLIFSSSICDPVES
jgi:hypothetical protein